MGEFCCLIGPLSFPVTFRAFARSRQNDQSFLCRNIKINREITFSGYLKLSDCVNALLHDGAGKVIKRLYAKQKMLIGIQITLLSSESHLKNEVEKTQSLNKVILQRFPAKYFTKDFRFQFCAIQEMEVFHFGKTYLYVQNPPVWLSAKNLKRAEEFNRETRMKISFLTDVSLFGSALSCNVSPVSEVADQSELSSLCQDNVSSCK